MARWSSSWTIRRLAAEPPLRVFTQLAVHVLPGSIRRKAAWDVVARPEYLVGVLEGADLASRDGVAEICVIEFGVAGGSGLVAMQSYAERVERETGVRIKVYGFDTGTGLPEHCGDYRDHPDSWKSGDYVMDHEDLRPLLQPRTELVLGNISETVPRFLTKIQKVPIGFVSVDVDFYSSSTAALKVLSLPGKNMLRRVPMAFDDVDSPANHKFAGELLAIREFNQQDSPVKIDRWRGLRSNRPFFEAPWLKNMYMAHDLEAISKTALRRQSVDLPLES